MNLTSNSFGNLEVRIPATSLHNITQSFPSTKMYATVNYQETEGDFI
jgi:hypothetical protein